MGIEIRNAAPEEFQAAIDVISTAFLERPDTAAVAELLKGVWDPGRVWIAYDEATPCGTFRSWGTQLTVPGGAMLPAAAVAAVTVLPTHRRRGILTAMAAREHAALVERGEAVGLLYASEATIYGRYGYAPGTRTTDWTINPRVTRVHGEPAGTVELLTPSAAARDPQPRRTTRGGRARRARSGGATSAGTWASAWPTRHGASAGRAGSWSTVTSRAPPTASCATRPTRGGRSTPRAGRTVHDLVSLTREALRRHGRFFSRWTSWRPVRLEGRREGEPLPWLLTNIRAANLVDAGDALWVRLFDVPRALEARTYEREASLVLEVVDDEARGGTRRLLLDAGPGGRPAGPTDRSPDLTLPVAALSAAYLGGTRLRDIVIATGADEHRPGALADADALLRTADPPWCSTFF